AVRDADAPGPAGQRMLARKGDGAVRPARPEHRPGLPRRQVPQLHVRRRPADGQLSPVRRERQGQDVLLAPGQFDHLPPSPPRPSSAGAPHTAGSYGRSHWMTSLRLPSGSATKKRSQWGIGVVSWVATSCWRKWDRAAWASLTRSAKWRGLSVSAWGLSSRCSCWPPSSNHNTLKSNVLGLAISFSPSTSR